MRSLWIAARAIVSGWSALLFLVILIERPLIKFFVSLIGHGWRPTAIVALDCSALAASGFAAGLTNRSRPFLAASCFALTLTGRDFSALVPLNVPWMVHLARDAIREPRFLESMGETLASHALLFACIFIGASFSREHRDLPATVLTLH